MSLHRDRDLQQDATTSSAHRLPVPVDKGSHLLVAWSREVEVPRQRADSSVRLGDRLAWVVEPGDRCYEPAVDSGSGRGHATQDAGEIRTGPCRLGAGFSTAVVTAVTFADVRLELVDGDITELEVDAIANAANDRLWMGAGVAGAIKRAGGAEIEREAMAKGPIAVGDALATSAGELRARWVIHGAVMGQNLRTSAQLVRRTTESVLRVADEVGATSVALPAFGTGVGGLPLDECAREMVSAVRAHRPATVEHVVFAVFGEETRRAFEEALTD